MKLIEVDKLKEILHNDKQLSSYNGIPKEVYDRLIDFIDANSVEAEEIKEVYMRSGHDDFVDYLDTLSTDSKVNTHCPSTDKEVKE